MYIPFLSTPVSRLVRRKGGGGGGGGGGGRGGGGGGAKSGGGGSGAKSGGGGSGGGGSGAKTGGGASSAGNTGKAGSSTPVKSASGSTSNARPYGTGSSKVIIIPSGHPFSGRSVGGGTRADIFGTQDYGSGYPGLTAPSVAGRGFPFGFWPITFLGLTAVPRFHSDEYGSPDNSSRPGGPLFDAPFQPPDGSNTYRILSDNTTVHSLIGSITSNCSLSTTSITAVPWNESDPFQPKPEQVIQYYRSSSIALSLDGYNNSAVFSNDTNAPNTSLPPNLDTTFLDCLNKTIGASAPLLDDATTSQASGLLVLASISLFLFQYCMWWSP